MKDKDAQLMMEALRDNDRWDARRGRGDGVDPETGEKQSGAEHAKHVQWTKDIEAKLSKAQEIGDSKEANKLQRYLDMHGVWEDNSLDDELGDDGDVKEPEYKVGDIIKSHQVEGEGLNGIIIDIYKEDGELMYALMEIGEEGWSVKASEVKPDDTPRTNW